VEWLPLAAVAVAALIVGFAAGWLLRGDGGEATVLPAADAAPLVEETPAPPPALEPTPPPQSALPRSEVDVAVLNGVGVAGLAGQAAETLRTSGYRIVQVDDGPRLDGPTEIFFVAGRNAEAQRLRRDLGITNAVTALPDGPVRDVIPEATQLVVLLGAG
jgi:hypothetical protein